jgi:chromosomal replication initiation ATPase DnaA
MSRSREHKVVHARHLLIWEIKTYVTQDITWNRLGRMFGGMDHTSIHYAFHKIAAMKAAGSI